MWKLLAVYLCVFSLLLMPGTLVVRAETGGSIFSSSLGDYRDDLEQARSQAKKGIILMLEKNGCPFCAVPFVPG